MMRRRARWALSAAVGAAAAALAVAAPAWARGGSAAAGAPKLGPQGIAVSMSEPRLGQDGEGVDYYGSEGLFAQVYVDADEALRGEVSVCGRALGPLDWSRAGDLAVARVDCDGLSSVQVEVAGEGEGPARRMSYGEPGTYDSEGSAVDGASFAVDASRPEGRLFADGRELADGEECPTAADACQLVLEARGLGERDEAVVEVGGAVDETWAETPSLDGGAKVYSRRFLDEGDHEVACYARKPWGELARLCSATLSIDRRAPAVEVEFGEGGPTGQVGGAPCYNEVRTATVRVAEEHFDPSLVDIEAPGGQASSWAQDGEGRHVATVSFGEDARCRLEVRAIDPAGNEAAPYDSGEFVVDLTAPRVSVSFEGAELGGERGGVGFFPGARTAAVRIEEENHDRSLVRIETDGELAWDPDDPRAARVEFPDDGEHRLRIEARDLAGNAAEPYECAPFVVDTQAPVVEVSYDGAPVAAERGGVSYLAGPRGALVRVADANFDAAASTVDATGEVGAWDEASCQARAEFSADGRHRLRVVARDLAGNVSMPFDSGEFVVDTQPPAVALRASRAPAGRGEGEDFFDGDLVLEVVAVDANLDAAGALSAQAAFESAWEEGPSDAWSKRLSFGEGSGYALEATVRDLAGNEARVAYGERTLDPGGAALAGPRFTVDSTPPAVSVSFDNEDARNGSYYNAPRTATVEVEDMTFDPDLMELRTSGEAGPWSRSASGAYAAEVDFSSEGEHFLEVSGRDKAGNLSEPLEAEGFTVDMTPPSIGFAGIEDGHAYAGDVAGSVSADDAVGLDAQGLSVELARDGEAVSLGAANAVAVGGGSICELPALGTAPENDGIYAVEARATDLAGNVAQARATFSLNRYGSTFRVANAAELGANGGYLPYAPEVLIEEINACGADSGERGVTVTGAAGAVELERREGPSDTGFAVEEASDEKGWERCVYRVFSGNFAEDGRYAVCARSLDDAGNANSASGFFDRGAGGEGRAEAGFTVDTAAPRIVDVSVAPGEEIRADSYEGSFTVREDVGLANVSARLDGEELPLVERGDGSYAFAADAKAGVSRRLEICARDLAGHVGTAKADGFCVSPAEASPRPAWALGALAAAGALFFFARERRRSR